MIEIKDLSLRDLVDLVESIQRYMYLDRSKDGEKFVWNPDKDWAEAETIENIDHVLSLYGLKPEEEEDAK
jgi:hypothetical protein